MARSDSFKVKRIKFHNPGFNDVRKSPALKADLEARGQRIADAATSEGGTFAVNVTETKSRVRVTVVTADIQAIAGEQKDRRLTRALDAGRS